ncbi:ankyrin [Coprinopsis marcescibilis]|uniref:Ankyrin n=1 Tax=Coprinopsis marcescibilis TaxID=230819 RepID=A0A5C3KHY0_COPMA|nr:ankyrin [Coprinopsis marcescibilis]
MCTYLNDDLIDVAVVAEALSIINFRNFLVDHLRKRVGKTGRWVISEPKFSKWRQGPRGILWGTGMPGAGKTILASIIIEYLMELAKSNQRICVAFAFSRYTDPLTVEEILAGLLRQILEDHPQTIVYIQRMHDHHSIRKTRPSKQELIGVLEAIFTSNLFDQRFCSLDGLDEAKSITQFELLEALSQLPVNLLITSRPLHLLEGNIPTADHFSIILQDADIERLIEERVRQIPTLASLLARDEFKKWVVKTVVEKSSGMFLVASLQLDSLVECVDIRELRQAVETLPVGVEAMYQATMLRVEAHRQAAKAKHALTWLVHALESLTMDGLRYAIAVDRETFEFEPELLINGGTLLSLCCGLVTYEPESDLVRLVHYTAKDFLEPYLKHEDPDPHAMIASTCATRLLQFNLNDVPVDMAAHIKNDGYRLDNFLYEDPFLPYSFHQWAKHSNFSAALPAPARDLILRSSSFPICTEDQYFICLGTSVHVAAAYNFHPLLEEWFHPSRHPADKVQSQLLPMYPQGVDINTDASDGSTALAIAAYCGHVDTVKLLLTVEGIDVEACGTCEPGRKPLVRAATAGHLDIVEMLLAVVGMDHTSAGLGSSALISASCGGHVEVVSTLLRFKIAYIEKFSQGDPSEEVSLIRECGEALVLAARNKYQDTIKTILGVKGINVNYHSPMYGRTALMFASMQGPKSTVEILLRCKDIAIDHPSPTGITALACALKSGQHNIAELLRLHGAEEPSADVFRSYIHNHSVKPWDIT